MPPNEILTGAQTMWELVARRADATPDHPMLIASDGESLTFGAFRDRVERVAAGLLDMGLHAGSVVSWQLPTRIDTVVLSLAMSRLGVVQNPIIHLYREREVGFAVRQTGASLLVIPATWRDIDFEAMAARAVADAPSPPEILVIDDGRGLPEGDPTGLPPARRGRHPRTLPSAGSTTPRARRPTPRASSTRIRRSSPGGGAWRRPSRCRRTTWAPLHSPSRTSPGPTTS
jgi:acyl-CoA synthetase (AMP-forming)/AMP-acid ligase II